ncbi:DUF4040 domain-containing protein [bacterium]|nr:DUF4040 domain-containing protein [bacterium]
MTLEYIVAALIILMIMGAVTALETDNLLSSIIALGAVGFLLAIAFLFLGAPDIAFTQIVVEILLLIILIRVTIHRDLKTTTAHRAMFGWTFAIVLIAFLTWFGLTVFEEFPAFGTAVMDRVADSASVTYIKEGLAKSGAGNLVTAVLLDFRAFDTLGEATVLFCAILGALAILRQKAHKHSKEKDQEADAA